MPCYFINFNLYYLKDCLIDFRKEKIGIMPTVLYNIGNTPLVQINKVHKTHGIECDIRK